MTNQIDNSQATQFRGARNVQDGAETPHPSQATDLSVTMAGPQINSVPMDDSEEDSTRVAISDAPDSVKNSLVGKQLDEYVVEKWLGGGGMGQVYLARHRWLDVPVAIKVMNGGIGEDPEAADRFRREAKMAAQLDHPNIVKATDGGHYQNSLYLVTEYIAGYDLKDVVVQSGPLLAKHAAWVIMEVAKGLQHAHERGLIHRDIKPSNIMLLKDGSVKVLDLGLARYTDAQTQMTATGQFMGTVDYVSPEQAVDTRNVDHRADIYSLGCTLYYLLTGRAPFEGEAYDTVISKILAHTEEEPLDIEYIVNGTPKGVIRILQQMMAKHPDDRFASCADIAAALSKFAEPVNGERRVQLANVAVSASASDNSDLSQSCSKVFESCSSGLMTAGWLICRTILSMLGIIERVEVNANSRLGGKKKYKWQMSVKGIAVVMVLTFFFLSVFVFRFDVLGFILDMIFGPPEYVYY